MKITLELEPQQVLDFGVLAGMKHKGDVNQALAACVRKALNGDAKQNGPPQDSTSARKPRKRLTTDERMKAFRFMEAGASYSEAATKFGISYSSARNIWNAKGKTTR